MKMVYFLFVLGASQVLLLLLPLLYTFTCWRPKRARHRNLRLLPKHVVHRGPCLELLPTQAQAAAHLPCLLAGGAPKAPASQGGGAQAAAARPRLAFALGLAFGVLGGTAFGGPLGFISNRGFGGILSEVVPIYKDLAPLDSDCRRR